MKRILAAVFVIGLVALPASPAVAEGTVSVTFDQTNYETSYTAAWTIGAALKVDYDGPYILNSGSGRVDFYLDGGVTPYAAAVPIQGDGRVYLAQRSDQPFLAPGVHSIRAVFAPAESTGLPAAEGSATVTVAALDLATRVDITKTGLDSATLELTGSGSAVDSFNGMPAGTWTVAASSKSAPTVELAVAQAHSSTKPLSVELPGLNPGKAYELSVTFTPHESLASGVTVKNAGPTQFSTLPNGLAGSLSMAVPTEPWVLIAAALVAVALVVLIVVFARRRLRPIDSGAVSEQISITDNAHYVK